MSVADVVARMRAIDDELPPEDGVAVFNRVYLTVTERVARAIEQEHAYEDPEFMAELDVRFADLFLDAYDAHERDRSKSWVPLFDARRRTNLFPVQFALAGMNTHIAHDLPMAVVRTCQELGREPDARVRRDYEAVNAQLADVEADVRRSFLSETQTRVDDEIGPIAHVISAWKIDKARDVAWATTEMLWSLRDLTVLRRAFAESLDLTVGMTSRMLLLPTRI